MSDYLNRVLEQTKAKTAHEPEFLQAVEEVLETLEPVIEAHPEYEKIALLERYNQVSSFSEGMAVVENNNKSGYINIEGKEIISCIFSI